MNTRSKLNLVILICGITFSGVSQDYQLDIESFPEDTVELPAQLENMRPGQVRDAVRQDAVCLLPVGNLQAFSEHEVIGLKESIRDSLNKLVAGEKTVIAPPIWYTPSGYLVTGPGNGAFDMSMDAFTNYLDDVVTNLVSLGFERIRVVVLNDLQQQDSPLMACARFVVANKFNNRWKEPGFGKNWWINPDIADKRRAVSGMYSVLSISGSSEIGEEIKTLTNPFRLENMTPAQVKDAVARNLVCFVPSGVIETHGNHNPIGCDAIEVEGPLLMAGAKADFVIAPTIWYGPTGVSCGDETVGNMNIDGAVYRDYISGVVEGLAAMGFKRIVFIQVHQGQNGPQWVSTKYGIARYYARFHSSVVENGRTPANITVMKPPFGQYDHAGINETSWMMYFRPDHTDLSLIRPGDFPYCWRKGRESNKASYERGRSMAEKTVEGFIELIEYQ
jgi:creatinine amidohydrolase/Fe(II)-dependent formamide hydrolase-like protein